ncbi:amino acid transporter [Polychaeton citri CBS 116435]|uniref:Amino acid transporter n=1 Tax=Polychaeton citri CBS 116435 TaxID=1314669 RepID=A0A9P4QFA6_9PEZI|nr:amino acid transporter [Polychaeton citri CBS 116435]
MTGFCFSIVSSWTALGGVLTIGIASGGPPVMVWSWLGVCALTLCVTYSFAEMCSAYPVAGGQYSWVAFYAPPKYARPLSFVTGWFMCIGIVAMGAVNNFVGANFVLGLANMNNPSFVIERWHATLTAYLIAVIAAVVNIWFSKLLDKLGTVALVWNIMSFFVVIITILACNDHKQPASFVFTEFQNDTGFPGTGMAVMIGLLQSFFGMCCWDAPSKMTEEMKDPAKEAPLAMILSVLLGTVTGFVFLICAFFCVGDLAATANTPTGVPLLQILLDSVGNVHGATTLGAMIAVIVLFSANSLMAEGSRALWAFSRDNGLPCSSLFSKVDKRTKVPVYSTLLCLIVQVALNSIYFGSYTGFSTVISIATFGFYLSYAMALVARLWSYVAGGKQNTPSAYVLGKWGPWLNAIGLVFLIFAGIDFNFPQEGPATADNMNYCSAAFGIVGLISLLTWLLDGRKNFKGPTDFIEGMESEQTSPSSEQDDEKSSPERETVSTEKGPGLV